MPKTRTTLSARSDILSFMFYPSVRRRHHHHSGRNQQQRRLIAVMNGGLNEIWLTTDNILKSVSSKSSVRTMAQQSYVLLPPYPPLVAVVSPNLCAPYPVNISFVQKVMTIADGDFVVTGLSDNIVFPMRGSVISLCHRRVLLDFAGNPLLTLQQKIISVHDWWKAYRGESSSEKDILFTVKRSSMIQLLRTKLYVFLANNTSKDRCDFRVEGSWLERSCVIYAGDSNSVDAQMHKKHTFQSVLLGKNRFSVTIYPNVDAAFITAIIVILDEINKEDESD